MPTYEYECTKCGAISEVVQSINEPPRRRFRKTDRPNCTCTAPVKRHIGRGAGIIFKGSGFYQTDYRSESYKKAAQAEKDNGAGKKAGDAKSDGSDKTKTAGDTKSPASKGSGE